MKPCRHFATYKAVYPPRCGCSTCWNKWFDLNMGVAVAVDSIIKNLGREAAIGRYGSGYIKQYERWLEKK